MNALLGLKVRKEKIDERNNKPYRFDFYFFLTFILNC